MFSLVEPSEGRISGILHGQKDSRFSYAAVGASREAPEKLAGYVVDRNRVRLGEGTETFDRAVARALTHPAQ